MSGSSTTHEILNQPPPFEDVNLFTSDKALMETVEREGGGEAISSAAQRSARSPAAARLFEHGRLANENPPRLETHDRQGHRRDTVEFHPAYHALMRTSCARGTA